MSAPDFIVIPCAECNARDARIAELTAENNERRVIGGQLANCAFNLAHNDALNVHDRNRLDALRKTWDRIASTKGVKP